MAEYIEREELYRRVKERTNPYGKPTLDYESGVKVLDMIKQAPAADVVEVVRCEKCKYWDEESKEKITYSSEDSTLVDFCECRYWSSFLKCYMTRYNDFCSCGERKNNDT